MKYKNKITEIHVFTRNGEYVRNILFDENIGVPMMSEEQFERLIKKALFLSWLPITNP